MKLHYCLNFVRHCWILALSINQSCGNPFIIRATSWKKKQQNDLWAQQRLRSAWASTQSDQSSLSTWRKLGSLATYWVHSEDSDQPGRTVILLVLSWGGSWMITETAKIFLSSTINTTISPTIWPIYFPILRLFWTVFFVSKGESFYRVIPRLFCAPRKDRVY